MTPNISNHQTSCYLDPFIVLYVGLNFLLIHPIIKLLGLQSEFQGWRKRSAAIKMQIGELEVATDSVVVDMRQFGESVSKVIIFHLMHITLHSVE